MELRYRRGKNKQFRCQSWMLIEAHIHISSLGRKPILVKVMPIPQFRYSNCHKHGSCFFDTAVQHRTKINHLRLSFLVQTGTFVYGNL